VKKQTNITELGRRFAPKYVDLAQRLLRDIAARQLKSGDLLGTEEELGMQHGLSRATVRQALAVLERDGFVRRHRAKGTFVGPAVASVEQHLLRGTALVVCSNEQTVHLDEDFAFATVLRSIERALGREGFSVQIMGVGEDIGSDRARLSRLVQQEDLQGICAIGSCLEPYRPLLPEVPTVTSCTFYPLPGPWAGQDVCEASREALKYLLDLGHRDVALVCSGAIDQRAFAVFVEGYKAAYRQAGQPFLRQQLYRAYFGEELPELAREVLTSRSRPTAVFAENWHVCQAFVAAASSLGMRIPDDVSLIGYGQNALQVVGPVGITSYTPDGERLGQEVARLLTDLVDGKPLEDGPHFVAGRLVERDSVRSMETSGTSN
jgi:LacI family transcriptional regulator